MNVMFLNLVVTVLNKKIKTLTTKSELKADQDKIVKLQAFDSSYFRGKSHFEDDGAQIYVRFRPICRFSKRIRNTDNI